MTTTRRAVSGSVDQLRPTAYRRNILAVRFSDAEIEILNRAAEVRNITVSALVRKQCFGTLTDDV